MPRSSPFSWVPYTSPPGSYVELFPDGSFELEGHDATFSQEEAVAVHNSVLAASKEAGPGEPLSLHLFRGAKPIHVLLCFGDLDNSGEEKWFRNEPKGTGAASRTASRSASRTTSQGSHQPASVGTPQPLPKTLPALPRANDGWFKVGFFVFLFWYLFGHHQVFKGVDATERYPSTVPRSSDDDYAPPQHIYRP